MANVQVRVPVRVHLDLSASDVHVAGSMNREPEGERELSMHAAICVVWDNAGHVLTISRKESPDEQGLPGGIVEVGETPVVAAVRELQEECGVRAEDAYCFWDGCGEKDKPLTEDGRQVHVCSVSQWSGLPHAAEMGTRCMWLTPDELLAQAKTFKSFLEEIKRRGLLDHGGTFPERGLGMKDVDFALKVLETKTRNDLPDSAFALPKQRKYPIADKAHVANATSRLEEEYKAKKISPADYHEARGRIAAAAKKFGVESQYNETAREADGPSAGLHVTIHHPTHGSVEIHHMKDGSKLFSGLRVQLVANDGDSSGPVWVNIATRGHFEGHGAGAFDLNDAVFNEIIKNYKDVDLGKVSWDFEHASEQDASEGSIPVHGAPAQAHIRDLKIGPHGLMALTEWLEPAKSYVKAGKYTSCSPAIRFGARHPVTGKPIGARLTSVALTNQPFLRGLQPLAAKDKAGVAALADGKKTYAYGAHEYMPMLRACLGASEDAEPQDLADRMKAMRAMHAMTGGAPMIASYVGSLRDNMRVPMTSTVEDIFDAVEAMISAAMQEHVDTMHPGQAAATARMDDEMAAMAATTAAVAATQQETAMTEANATPNAELVTKLSEATTKLTETDAQVATLTLKLGERDAVITAKDALITAKDTEITALKAEVTKRDEADLDRVVATAMLYHGEAQKLTGKEKMLRICAKADRAEFDKLYPIPMTADGKLAPPYMLRSVPKPFGREVPTQTEAGASPLVESATMPLDQLALKLIEESIGKDGVATLSLADAQNNALKLRNAGQR